MVNREPAHPSGKTLVEPQLVPPVHGDQVTEPLMRKLVGNNVSYPVTVAICRCGRIEEYCGSSSAIVSIIPSTSSSEN